MSWCSFSFYQTVLPNTAAQTRSLPSSATLVRLVNAGSLSSFGRVEVLYNGTWGTICDHSWDLQDAEVVCRQLGYDGAVTAPQRAAFGQGTGQIWLSHIRCVGNEASISECSHRGWGVNSCKHYKDAGVHCKPRARLVGGPSVREGAVQVYYNNTWGWVCDDQWDKRDADVVCRMMTYTGASSVPGKSSAINQSDLILMSNVQCTGNENSLFSCVGGWRNHSCISGYKADAVCRAHEDKRMTLERIAEEAEMAAHQNNLKELYMKTKLLSGYLKKPSTGIRAKDGTVITIEEEVLERVKEHFYEVLNVACEETGFPEGCQLDICEEPIEMDTSPFTIEEVRRVISGLKNGKAPGADNISAEMLNASPTIALYQLLNICNQTLDQCKAPSGKNLSWPKCPRKAIHLSAIITVGYPYYQYLTRSSADCCCLGYRKE
ncbi:hypothetical protein ACROYT_G028636 [Oculina patagonica]